MTDWIPANLQTPQLLLIALAVLVVIALLIYWRRRRQPLTLKQVFNSIAFERIDGLVVPNTDEGEIQIDHLLLTAQGLVIIDVKDVIGTVFGSDKMQDWTVISTDRRFTFPNPQPALYDRIAAVSNIVRQVPVSGRILFMEGAEFTKGVPGMVCTAEELMNDFTEKDKDAAKAKVDAFRAQWSLIESKAISRGLKQTGSMRLN